MPPKHRGKGRGGKKAAAAARVTDPSATDDSTDHDERETQDNVSEAGSLTSTTSSTVKPKRKKQSRRLIDKDEVEMLEYLKSHPFMWDMKSLEYRNAVRKSDAWEDLAKTIGDGMTADHLKAAFKNLRNWYSRLDLEGSKSGTAPRVPTGRELQVQDRMQFMQNTVTHRPAPMASPPGVGGTDSSLNTIASLDDAALDQSTSQSLTKKRTTPSASASIVSTDSEAIGRMESTLSKNREDIQKLSSAMADKSAAVDLDDPQSASRAIKRAYATYVTTSVQSYNENEFDEFQCMFTDMEARFKAARRGRAATTRQLLRPEATMPTPYYTPTASTSATPYQQYEPPAPPQSPRYQIDQRHWAPELPAVLKGSSLYRSQTPEFNAQYAYHTQHAQRLPPPVQRHASPHPHPAEVQNRTSTPTRQRTSPSSRDVSSLFNVSDVMRMAAEPSPEQDSQDIVLQRLEPD